MGGRFSKKVNENGYFYDGPTDFHFDEAVPLFENKNGLVFRLISHVNKQWAFYNDSKKYEFHITVTFSEECRNLTPLGKASLVQNPEGGWIGKIIVYPCQTEPFVEGDIVGFESVVNAVLLTTEYTERRKEEKREAKKAAKAAKKNGGAANDDVDSGNSNPATHQNGAAVLG